MTKYIDSGLTIPLNDEWLVACHASFKLVSSKIHCCDYTEKIKPKNVLQYVMNVN